MIILILNKYSNYIPKVATPADVKRNFNNLINSDFIITVLKQSGEMKRLSNIVSNIIKINQYKSKK